ncbi:hypothetical protein [Roseovarius gahaiensis]
MVNLRYEPGKTPLNADAVQEAIAKGEERLGADGRLLIR